MIPLSVGYQLPDRYSMTEVVETYREAIGEVYFPWYGVPDGRGVSIRFEKDQKQMEYELANFARMGIRLNLLLNANCYGEDARSVRFRDQIRETISWLRGELGLHCVTTTSLFVAHVCREYFPELEVRASVNMEIATAEAMRYVSGYFDSFYAARALNRDIPALRMLRKSGKKIYMLANSGCLKNCSAHVFHDNLVAHETAAGKVENCWNFRGICWEFLGKKENRCALLADSTWVRPEELELYEGVVDGIKLATRTNPHFGTIVKAYAERSFHGNILSLCEPDFSALADLENKNFPENWRLSAADAESAACRELYLKLQRG